MPPERQRHHPDQLMLQAFLKWSLIASLWFQPPIGTGRRKLYIPTSCQLWPQNSGVVWKTWCKLKGNWEAQDSRPPLSNIYSDSLTTWVSAFKNASEFAAAICCGVSAFVVQLAETRPSRFSFAVGNYGALAFTYGSRPADCCYGLCNSTFAVWHSLIAVDF